MAVRPLPLLPILRNLVVGLVRQDHADLTARQLAVLLIAYLEDGPHTVRSLAQRLNVAKPAISRALDRLEQFDLAKRLPDPHDRRSVNLGRTSGGAAYMEVLTKLLNGSAAAA
jgi:DNA-binding MarR family transcriptional regulator